MVGVSASCSASSRAKAWSAASRPIASPALRSSGCSAAWMPVSQSISVP
jgi:hypothetical protein